MSDIQVICPNCGRPSAVSEFADEQSAVCPACGQALVLPERPVGHTGLTLKRRDPPRPRDQAVAAAAPGPCGSPQAAMFAAARRSIGRRRAANQGPARAPRAWLNGLVFLVLAGGLAYMRFCGGWPGLPLATLKLYGLLAMAAAYLVIIGLALRDNMFDGLFAIVVPLYPFYYLFFSSSALFMRALVGALLVAFGYDTLLYLQGWAAGMVNAVKLWMQHV
jgi:hypothetical protein